MLVTRPWRRTRWLHVLDRRPFDLGLTNRLSPYPPRPSPYRPGWLTVRTNAADRMRGRFIVFPLRDTGFRLSLMVITCQAGLHEPARDDKNRPNPLSPGETIYQRNRERWYETSKRRSPPPPKPKIALTSGSRCNRSLHSRGVLFGLIVTGCPGDAGSRGLSRRLVIATLTILE